MSKLSRRNEKCAVCGKESGQVIIISTNEMFSRDLDHRPGEMLRSTMRHWVHECPNCGYVSSNLEDTPEKFEFLTPGLLESAEYRTCDGLEFTSKLAEQFYRLSMIEGDLAHYVQAINAILEAAWACDDVGDIKNAMICRSRAICYLDWLIYEACPKKDSIYNIQLRIDLMRRIGAFDAAFSESYERIRSFLPIDTPVKLLMFEYYLSWKRDSKAYTYADAEDFAKNHPHNLQVGDIEDGMKAMKGDRAFETAEHFFNNLLFGGYEFFENSLAEEAEYYSQFHDCTVTGKKAVWEKLMEIASSRQEATNAIPAVVTWASEEDEAQGFAKGTHCLALKYAEDEIVRSLVIIKGNEGGQVLSIRIADVGKKEFVLCPRRQITLPN